MNDDLRELSGLDALGALDARDAARLADAAANDAELERNRAADRDVIARVERALPRVAPRGDLIDEIVAAAHDEGVRSPARALVNQPPHRRRWVLSRRRTRRLVPLIGVAAAACIVAAVAIVNRDPASPRSVLTAAIVASDGRSLDGTAALFTPDRPGGHLVVDVTGLEGTPPAHHYEVWVLKEGSTAMESVGSFRPLDRQAHLDLPLPGPGRYVALDISLEPDGGPPSHSDVSVAGAKFPKA